ncbi:MAG: homoserine dehydrogenase [Nitrospinota bacterium]|nr:homoserine dehydrogenase [Nitrospinota bacterium]
MKKIGVGILGCGVIGSAVVKNLILGAEDISRRCGLEVEIKKIAELDFGRKKGVPESAGPLFTKDLNEIIASKEIDIVVELMGGLDFAFETIIKAIKAGKHIVTANKHLIAKKGEKIYEEAQKAGVEFCFEASVAGAVPIIRTLKEGIVAGKIHSVLGIINGTANYILTKMTESNANFADVLAEAQRLGYAEKDPTFDIEGIDAAHKIAIMASLSFGTPVDFDSILVEGISRLNSDDFDYAKKFDKVIKLLGIARMDNGKIDVRVHPAMLDCGEPLAKVNGVTNAVELKVSHADELMLIGPGAGGDATSSAVIADIVEIARNINSGSVGRVAPAAFIQSARKNLPMKPIEEIECCYYLRFYVEDRPGVLASMAKILGDNNISISTAYQKDVHGDTVPLMITTHTALEKNIRAAVEKIDKLETTKDKTVIIRLEE